MITGAIAVVIGIAMIACASNGEWGAFAVGAVIVVLLLALGSESRKSDRALNNFVDYWAGKDKGGAGTSKGTVRTGSVRTNTRRVDRKPVQTDMVLGAVKTAGDMQETLGTTWPCRACGGQMEEINRVKYGSGSVFVTYRCPVCGHERPVKMQ